jgi:hypothetical protein
LADWLRLVLEVSNRRGAAFGKPSKEDGLRSQLTVDGERWLGREGMGEFLKRGESGRL